MAKYGISQSGIESLNKLISSLSTSITDIEYASRTLYNSIDNLEDGLGVYYKDILILVRKTINMLKEAKEGEDGIDLLITRIMRLRSLIEEFISQGIEGEDEEPAQKKLVLKRR